MKLSTLANGRDNNFNLIRIVAALAVLVSHSFALSTGIPDAEPLQHTLGMTLGSIAVDVFFITSGFLVTASLLARQRLREYFWARILRIFPALWAMLLLSVFGLGAFFTSLPLLNYLTDSRTYTYLVKCSTLAAGVAYDLPGVFEHNPYRHEVNGSLWTMPYEVRMYVILALAWAVLRITKRYGVRTFEPAIVAGAIAACALSAVRHFYTPLEGDFTRFFFMFFSGAAYYVLREHITLSRTYFLPFATALLVAAFANRHAFYIVYIVTIAYLLFYLAYMPSGIIRKFNRAGDYSYGVYLYAYPVQQSVASLIPGVSVLSLLLLSASASLVLAAISWHFLERHALALKKRFTFSSSNPPAK